MVKNEDIIKNDCNLSVSSYVEQPDTREKINIAEDDLVNLIKCSSDINKKLEKSFNYEEDFPLVSVTEMNAVINPLRTFNNFAGSGFDCCGRY